MGIIVPALLVQNENELKEKLKKIIGIVHDIQIDVIDGEFASPPTWPYTESSGEFSQHVQQQEMLSYCEKFTIETDLMVTDITEAAFAWSAVGAARLVLHTKKITDIESALSDMEKHFGYEKGSTPSTISVGVALAINDTPDYLDSIIDRINFVQCMGIAHVGRQGESFDERVLSLVQSIHQRHPNISIQVDGGVSLTNTPALLRAGVNRLIIGSAIWRAPNVVARIHEFEDLVQQYGTYE